MQKEPTLSHGYPALFRSADGAVATSGHHEEQSQLQLLPVETLLHVLQYLSFDDREQVAASSRFLSQMIRLLKPLVDMQASPHFLHLNHEFLPQKNRQMIGLNPDEFLCLEPHAPKRNRLVLYNIATNIRREIEVGPVLGGLTKLPGNRVAFRLATELSNAGEATFGIFDLTANTISDQITLSTKGVRQLFCRQQSLYIFCQDKLVAYDIEQQQITYTLPFDKKHARLYPCGFPTVRHPQHLDQYLGFFRLGDELQAINLSDGRDYRRYAGMQDVLDILAIDQRRLALVCSQSAPLRQPDSLQYFDWQHDARHPEKCDLSATAEIVRLPSFHLGVLQNECQKTSVVQRRAHSRQRQATLSSSPTLSIINCQAPRLRIENTFVLAGDDRAGDPGPQLNAPLGNMHHLGNGRLLFNSDRLALLSFFKPDYPDSSDDEPATSLTIT